MPNISVMNKYIVPNILIKYGISVVQNSKMKYDIICPLVALIPFTTGNIGIFAFRYSSEEWSDNDQKWGGVHIKTIKNSNIGSNEMEGVTDTHPIIGGNAPAAPPITIFCAVRLLRYIV